MNFFILGNPRSGTTLLRLMLNSNSKIGVPPECGMVLWWYKKYSAWNVESNNNKELVAEFVKDILSSKKVEGWGISEKEIYEVFKLKPENYKKVFEILYKVYTKKAIVGDKNNYFINELDSLNLIYPDSKYIHLIRDGRDVACSYIKIRELEQSLKYIPKLSNDIEQIAKEWSVNIGNVEAFIQDKNSITVKYEDLLSKPKESLSKITEFLGADYESKMLEFSKNNNEPESTIHWKQKTKESLDSSNQSKYRKILTKNEINQFNAIALNTLTRFNYEA